MKVRCFRCSNAFQLTTQQIANNLAAQGVSGRPSHYVAECPHCRQAIKISLKGVRLPEPERVEGGTEEEGPRPDNG